MKKLFTMLCQRQGQDRWWVLKETTHSDPPSERVYMFNYPQIIEALKQKLSKWSGL